MDTQAPASSTEPANILDAPAQTPATSGEGGGTAAPATDAPVVLEMGVDGDEKPVFASTPHLQRLADKLGVRVETEEHFAELELALEKLAADRKYIPKDTFLKAVVEVVNETNDWDKAIESLDGIRKVDYSKKTDDEIISDVFKVQYPNLSDEKRQALIDEQGWSELQKEAQASQYRGQLEDYQTKQVENFRATQQKHIDDYRATVAEKEQTKTKFFEDYRGFASKEQYVQDNVAIKQEQHLKAVEKFEAAIKGGTDPLSILFGDGKGGIDLIRLTDAVLQSPEITSESFRTTYQNERKAQRMAVAQAQVLAKAGNLAIASQNAHAEGKQKSTSQLMEDIKSGKITLAVKNKQQS